MPCGHKGRGTRHRWQATNISPRTLRGVEVLQKDGRVATHQCGSAAIPCSAGGGGYKDTGGAVGKFKDSDMELVRQKTEGTRATKELYCAVVACSIKRKGREAASRSKVGRARAYELALGAARGHKDHVSMRMCWPQWDLMSLTYPKHSGP